MEKLGQESYPENICSPRSPLAPWNSHAGGIFPAPVINTLAHVTKFPSGNKNQGSSNATLPSTICPHCIIFLFLYKEYLLLMQKLKDILDLFIH